MPRWDRPRATRDFVNAVINGVIGAVLVGVVIPASIPLRVAAGALFLAVSVLVVFRLRAVETDGKTVKLIWFVKPTQTMDLAPPFEVKREKVFAGVERVTFSSAKESLAIDMRPSLTLKTAWLEHVAKKLNELETP
jgi:hypothetical protein